VKKRYGRHGLCTSFLRLMLGCWVGFVRRRSAARQGSRLATDGNATPTPTRLCKEAHKLADAPPLIKAKAAQVIDLCEYGGRCRCGCVQNEEGERVDLHGGGWVGRVGGQGGQGTLLIDVRGAPGECRVCKQASVSLDCPFLPGQPRWTPTSGPHSSKHSRRGRSSTPSPPTPRNPQTRQTTSKRTSVRERQSRTSMSSPSQRCSESMRMGLMERLGSYGIA
jgi:hypothetical protein